MTKTLVTGATGFLGGAVVAALREAGENVVGTGRNLQKCADRGFTAVNLSTPIESWPDLGEINQIVHCAALSAPFGRYANFMNANVVATQNLVTFAKRQNVSRFVHVSTSSVYFAPKDQLKVTENCPLPRPINAYAKTKHQSEDIVLDAGNLSPIVLRPRGIYGIGDTALLPRLLRVAARRPLPIFRDGTAEIDLTHVDDVVSSVLAALNAPKAVGIFNISGGEPLLIQDIVNAAAGNAGVSVAWRKQPLKLAMGFAAALENLARIDPFRREPIITRYALGLFAYKQGLSIQKARDQLNWTPKVDFAEGLKRTFSP
ncbi:MAG: NAD(P)-dependent oxidoreductase [Yoonia sp.]|uniref:NAD-dependent epimerase/dehydratase family protein n=1 Tax=Yoonia sp. TaxID=2212373 RepID=UPI003263EEF5